MIYRERNFVSRKSGVRLQIHHRAEGVLGQFHHPLSFNFAQLVANEGRFRVFEEIPPTVHADPRMTDKNEKISDPGVCHSNSPG